MLSQSLLALVLATSVAVARTSAAELPTVSVDLGFKTKNMDVNSRTGVQVCAGLMNRDPTIIGPAYVLKEQRDVDWYEDAGGEVGAGAVRVVTLAAHLVVSSCAMVDVVSHSPPLSLSLSLSLSLPTSLPFSTMNRRSLPL